VSNSYLANAAAIAGAGRDQGLEINEVVDALEQARYRKERRKGRAMDGEDRRQAAAFDMAAAGVPPELGGFNYGNGGEDIEFGADQADWQIAQADDKDIVAKKLRRAQQAAADIGFDARMREEGDGARVRRAQAIMELREDRADFDNPGEYTDPRIAARMRKGSSIQEDPYLVGRRGPDGNLQSIARKRYIDKEGNDRGERIKRVHGFVDKRGNVREPQKNAQEAEPDFPLGFENPADRDKRMISEIRRERAEANILRAQNPRVNITPNADGALIDPAGIGNLERMGDILDVGNLKAKLPAKAGGFNEGQFFPEAVKGDIDVFAPYGTDNQGAYFDRDGAPIGIQGPSPANSVDPGQVANAPRDVRQWAIRNAPSYKDGGRIFGDFPQVDIGGAGNDFLARIAKIKANGQAFDPGVSAIRNIEDLQAVVDRFGDFQQAGGLKAFALDADNNEVFVDRAGLPEIFQKMKMNANAQGRLANMLFQLEAGKANGVNAEQRALFEQGLDQFGQRGKFEDIFIPDLVNGGSGVANFRNPQAQVQFGARLPQFGNDEAQLQKIPRGAIEVAADQGGNAIPRLNVGVDAVGAPMKQEMMAALQGLQGNQAQPPLDANELRDARNGMVGLVQGEGRGNYGFAKPIPEGVDDRQYFMDQARDRAKGKAVNVGRINQNVDRRRDIIAREKAARTAPNQVLGVVGTAERALQEKGALFPKGKANIRVEGNEDWKYNPDLNALPNEPVVMSTEQIARRRGFNPGAEATPDAFSMPKSNPIVAQASAPNQTPLSGISYNEMAPDPWQTPPATGSGISNEVQRRMPASMLNELAELNSGPNQGPVRAPRQGPTQAMQPRERSFGERRDFAINKIKGYATSPRFQTGRRRAYGAGAAVAGLAGIDALIGGESERRQEEQYQ
jgi:hypothetical protein